MTTAERLRHLAEVAEPVWGRPVTFEAVDRLFQEEMGPQPSLQGQRVAVPVPAVCHVISGNTPQAGLQSLWRGLVAGVPRQLVKLPGAGLPELDRWVADLPWQLREGITLVHELPDETLADYPVVAVFGRDQTIEAFRRKLRADQRLLAYGHRFSVGVIMGAGWNEILAGAVQDILLFDQLGCLSLRTILVSQSGDAFAEALAGALQQACAKRATTHNPAVAAEIHEARNRIRLRMALAEPLRIWTEKAGLPWTVIWNPTPEPVFNPLHRFVEVRPYPGDLAGVLGTERDHLAAVALHPCASAHAETLLPCRPSRICRFGELQLPPIDWPQENRAPFDGFVQWVEIETKQPSG